MLFDIAIDMWLLQEPLWEQPSDSPTGVDDDTASSSAGADGDGPEPDPSAVLLGYQLVTSYFWHCEDNAFAAAWRNVFPEARDPQSCDDDARRNDEARLEERRAAAHRADDATDATDATGWDNP